jgi:hypothetical protein
MKEHFEKHAAEYAWIGLAAYVVAADILLPETLSSAVDRALDHPTMKYVAYGIGGVVAGHLFNILPEKFDPIHKSGVRLGIE